MRVAKLFCGVLFCVSILCGSVHSAQVDEYGESQTRLFFIEKSTWQETMLASRQAYMQNCDETVVEFGPWHTTGPLQAKKFSDTFFPEEKVDLGAKDENGKALWNKGKIWADGKIHLLNGGANSATFLYRQVNSSKATTAIASLGSDDGIEVWLNGKKILSHDVPRGASPDQERVDLQLNAGNNDFLMKIYNNSGGYGFYFSFVQDSALLRLWNSIEKKYPRKTGWMNRDLGDSGCLKWFYTAKDADIEKKMIGAVLADMASANSQFKKEYNTLVKQNVSGEDVRWLDLYSRAASHRDDLIKLKTINIKALRLAIKDLHKTYPGKYKGEEYLGRLEKAEKFLADETILSGDQVEDIITLQDEALLSNPLLDFDELILVRRSEKNHGLINNWLVNSAIPKNGFDNEIALLSLKSRDAEIKTLYKPDRDVFVGDVDLHFDGDKMLFSMIDSNNSWQLWEVGIDGEGLKQVTPADEFKYDNFDGCYLPDGRVIFASTRMFHGVPCVGGASEVANLFLLDRKNDAVRQLCYDQDQNWSPAVANNGRVMFTRWEYSDTPHYFSRLVMTMNPDGTDQKAYYGSNSYWPNSIFFARPVPNHPTKFVSIISGHHGVPRMGELVIFDPAIGRFEADGVVQRIPGFGKKVEPIIVDQLVDSSWPKFLHPYPLSDKYFLVSCQPDPQSLWGIYLVDIFDNMTLIKELGGNCLFEPVPLRKTKMPPMIADRVDLTRNDSTVMITDIYEGPGLADVPRGTIKKLRIYELHYAYMQMGGHKNVAVEGCWDVRRILGTVDVNADGSASFTVPANMPHAIQCLDSDGAAVQVMQSWYTSMPGEIISCVGCHENQNTTPPNKRVRTARGQPSKITPWYGPTRGFSFNREVQPVLDKYCIGCHNGQNQSRPDFGPKEKNGWGNFPEPYLALHPYVRRSGPESDYHLTNPYEYHTNTSELVQMLRKGHHGVKLDGESWDRIITWIDLNVPAHGTWGEHTQIVGDQCDMRIKMRTKYAGRDENPEKIFQTKTEPVKFVEPVEPTKPKPLHNSCEDWPFDSDKAKQLQEQSSKETFRSIDLGNGVNIRMVRIPAGQFIMGSTDGSLDEMPASKVNIDKPFWMATTEITNQQFKRFDSSHDNGYFDQQHKDHTTPGYFAGQDKYPVMRVSWYEAVEFCKWLSKETSLEISLPTEAQWEWACRAGCDSALNFGNVNSDFSKYANLADASLSKMAVSGVNPQPVENPSPYDAFIPRITTVDDGSILMDVVAGYQPNAWGLYDMHGNVAEWTLSDYVSYPYSTSNKENSLKDKTARGGSWRDRPKRATSSFRLGYKPHQKVYNVGFRIIASDR